MIVSCMQNVHVLLPHFHISKERVSTAAVLYIINQYVLRDAVLYVYEHTAVFQVGSFALTHTSHPGCHIGNSTAQISIE